MNYNFSINLDQPQKYELFSSKKHTNSNTIRIKNKNHNIESEYHDKVIQSYFIEKMLSKNNNEKDLSLINTVYANNLDILEKLYSFDDLTEFKGKKDFKQKKNKNIDVYIDIEEDLYVQVEQNKIINSYIIGHLILKKGMEDGMIVGIDRKSKIDDISGYLVDVNRLDVEVRENVFMTYTRKKEDFEIPVEVTILRNRISLKKLYVGKISNLIVKIPISRYCYKTEPFTKIGDVRINESLKDNERYIYWEINSLNDNDNSIIYDLELVNRNLPEFNSYDRRSIHISFEIDFYNDQGVEIKSLKRSNGKKANTFVSSKLKTVEFEIIK